jgi:hypothetical protein
MPRLITQIGPRKAPTPDSGWDGIYKDNIPVIEANIIQGTPPALPTNKTGSLSLDRSISLADYFSLENYFQQLLTGIGSDFCVISNSADFKMMYNIVRVSSTTGNIFDYNLMFRPLSSEYSNVTKNIGSTSQIIYDNYITQDNIISDSDFMVGSAWNNEVWYVNYSTETMYRALYNNGAFEHTAVAINPVKDFYMMPIYNGNILVDSTNIAFYGEDAACVAICDKNFTYNRFFYEQSLYYYRISGVYPNYILSDALNAPCYATRDGGLNWYAYTPSNLSFGDLPCFSPPYFVDVSLWGASNVFISVDGLVTYNVLDLSFATNGYDVVGIHIISEKLGILLVDTNDYTLHLNIYSIL